MEKENNELNMRDLFISHASEDKADFVRPLVNALIRRGVSSGNEFELTIGDDLLAKINDGLVKARLGLYSLSQFFQREEDLAQPGSQRDVRPRGC